MGSGSNAAGVILTPKAHHVSLALSVKRIQDHGAGRGGGRGGKGG